MHNLFDKLKVDCLIVSNDKDIYHHTNFNGSFGILLCFKNRKILITDPRYKHFKTKKAEVLITKDLKKDIKKILIKEKIQSVSFQNQELKYSSYWNLKKIFKNCKFKQDNGSISKLRVVKNKQEIQKLTAAQRLNEQTLHKSLPFLKAGTSEKEFKNIIKINALTLGAEGFSFEPIVAFGKNSANIHHSATDYKLKNSDVVLIDMGVTLDGYQSDMSRTFLPKSASEDLKNDYLKVLESFNTGIKNSKNQIRIIQLDKIAREPLHPDNFNHALGHGIGLDVHEQPFISKKSKEKLHTNMMITIEPGIYRKNKYGIRIEDVVVVGLKNGKSISSFPRDISQVIWG